MGFIFDFSTAKQGVVFHEGDAGIHVTEGLVYIDNPLWVAVVVGDELRLIPRERIADMTFALKDVIGGEENANGDVQL